jgi:hypothetical protein
VRAARWSDVGLPGEEPEPGRPRIQGINDRRAGDQIVGGAVLALHEDAGHEDPPLTQCR